jgi:hypothetical protein
VTFDSVVSAIGTLRTVGNRVYNEVSRLSIVEPFLPTICATRASSFIALIVYETDADFLH